MVSTGMREKVQTGVDGWKVSPDLASELDDCKVSLGKGQTSGFKEQSARDEAMDPWCSRVTSLSEACWCGSVG